ncbi:MAG: S41 family peptidase [Brevinema sp.]
MNSNKILKILRVTFLFSIIGVSFFSGILIANFQLKSLIYGKESKADENYFRYYNMFREAYKILQDEYVNTEKLDSKTLLTGAIKGLLSATEDPYTDFLTPEIAEEFSNNINASFYGVGIRIEMRNNLLTIISPIQGTPAAQANVQPGDRIIKINGESTEGITSLEAVNKIRGKLGTTVTLTLLRAGALESFDIPLKRAKIDIETIESSLISYENKKIAYIKIIEFGIPTEKDFVKHLKTLLKEKPQGLILDVRNNPGGLLSSVANIADNIIDNGLIVYTRGRITNENYEFVAHQNKTLIPNDLPVVILGNQGSASASEILIGALKDTKRAIVVGKTTFGKGSVQKTRQLSDGSILKYTVAKYYTPSGNVIDKIGIAPNSEVNLWYDNLNDSEKTELIRLQITNIIPEFLYSNKNPLPIDITNLHKKIQQENKIDVSFESLNNIIRQRMNFTSNKIYDLEIDQQLTEALKIIQTNNNTNYIYNHKTKTIEELKTAEIAALEELKKKNKAEQLY